MDIHAKALFPGHEVEHVLERGWDGLSNGKLLAAAAAGGFEALVTVDKNIRYQQNLDTIPISVLELDVLKNRMDELAKLSPFITRATELAAQFRFVSVNGEGTLECLSERAAPRDREEPKGSRKSQDRDIGR
ncbi:MAG: hypothetical protein ACKVW3_11450 [Phycisphaerales bacterium]